MLKDMIVINGCEHFAANREQPNARLWQNLLSSIEVDLKIKHPLGMAYKIKKVNDNPIRMVVQPDKSFLMFNVHEWSEADNSNFAAQESMVSDAIINYWDRLKNTVNKLYGKKNTAQLRTGSCKRWRGTVYPCNWQV